MQTRIFADEWGAIFGRDYSPADIAPPLAIDPTPAPCVDGAELLASIQAGQRAAELRRAADYHGQPLY
jgi:hypothetical protein